MKKNTSTGATMKILYVADAITSFKTFGNWIKTALSFTLALRQEDPLAVLSTFAGAISVGSVLSTAQFSLAELFGRVTEARSLCERVDLDIEASIWIARSRCMCGPR
jgi:hypothetical protein